MYILQISRHSPESCPMSNEKARNMTANLLKNQDKIFAKHGVKLVCSWSDIPGHEIFNIYEAPSMEAYTGMLQEPEIIAWLSFHRSQNRVVMSLDQIKSMLHR